MDRDHIPDLRSRAYPHRVCGDPGQRERNGRDEARRRRPFRIHGPGVDDTAEQRSTPLDPLTHRRARQVDAVAGEDRFLLARRRSRGNDSGESSMVSYPLRVLRIVRLRRRPREERAASERELHVAFDR